MVEINDENFDVEVKGATQPVVIDFWAAWCGPCKVMTPVFEKAAEELGDRYKFVKVNVDESNVSQAFGIRSIPTFVVWNGGEVVGTAVGVKSFDQFCEWIERCVPSKELQ